jgi:hypothetical protein
MRGPLGARMRIVDIRRLVVALALNLGCRGKSPPLLEPTRVPSAQLSPSAFVLVFPESACGSCKRPPEVLPNRFAGPFWEVMVKADTGWLAAVHQVEPDSGRQLPAFSSVAALVESGRPQNCHLDSHVMTCGEPLKAHATLRPGLVVLTVTDARWLDRLRASHPPTAHLAFRQHNTTTVWQDSVQIEYVAP